MSALSSTKPLGIYEKLLSDVDSDNDKDDKEDVYNEYDDVIELESSQYIF